MLKPLLLSGWFRVQPFLKYIVVVILIAPLVVASDNSSSAKSKVAKITQPKVESDSAPISTQISDKVDSTQILKSNQVNSLTPEDNSLPKEVTIIADAEVSKADDAGFYLQKGNSLSIKVIHNDHLAKVEFVPRESKPEIQVQQESSSQRDLIQRLKSFKNQALVQQDNNLLAETPVPKSLQATNIAPPSSQLEAQSQEVPVVEHGDDSASEQQDPLGSPHPIPWTWIMATQKAISANGGQGTRYYRSVPVISPDGRYAIYSRVQLEVKPQMYKSRVSSVLFMEDLQTKKLQVLASTSRTIDPLLMRNQSPSEEADKEGKIGVLVPVSWSQKGDRFLARKFEGVFDTSDLTDHAVVWDQQKNQVNTVSPVNPQEQHEKIAILLGWSKIQPDYVLFRTGQLGDENWPLMRVAYDGKVINQTNQDQPVIFGRQKNAQIWVDPQVATR